MDILYRKIVLVYIYNQNMRTNDNHIKTNVSTYYYISVYVFIYYNCLIMVQTDRNMYKQTNKLHGLSPRANYTDRA
jgi:hypothetical protein